MSQKKQLKDLKPYWDKIVEAYQKGLSIGDLCVHYDCSEVLIRRVLTTQGVQIRARGAAAKPGAPVTPEASPELPQDIDEAGQMKSVPNVTLLPNDYRPRGWRLQ